MRNGRPQVPLSSGNHLLLRLASARSWIAFNCSRKWLSAPARAAIRAMMILLQSPVARRPLRFANTQQVDPYRITAHATERFCGGTGGGDKLLAGPEALDTCGTRPIESSGRFGGT